MNIRILRRERPNRLEARDRIGLYMLMLTFIKIIVPIADQVAHSYLSKSFYPIKCDIYKSGVDQS